MKFRIEFYRHPMMLIQWYFWSQCCTDFGLSSWSFLPAKLVKGLAMPMKKLKKYLAGWIGTIYQLKSSECIQPLYWTYNERLKSNVLEARHAIAKHSKKWVIQKDPNELVVFNNDFNINLSGFKQRIFIFHDTS